MQDAAAHWQHTPVVCLPRPTGMTPSHRRPYIDTASIVAGYKSHAGHSLYNSRLVFGCLERPLMDIETRREQLSMEVSQAKWLIWFIVSLKGC